MNSLLSVLLSIGWIVFGALCESKGLKETIDTDPRFTEASLFLSDSPVLAKLQDEADGTKITALIPSNSAWRAMDTSKREYYLDASNADELETLILFSIIDQTLPQAIASTSSEPYFSLIGTQTEFAGDQVCNVNLGNDVRECTNVVQWDVPVDEGLIHIVDSVVYPSDW